MPTTIAERLRAAVLARLKLPTPVVSKTASIRRSHLVDVTRRPELARRYHVAVVPAAFRVAGDGTVLERLA